ncbi:MAG TPA: hypothetical protein VFN67_27580 [Polyangiales bacterium]|nr:hypothetical protein [Polyangiales bacterium]
MASTPSVRLRQIPQPEPVEVEDALVLDEPREQSHFVKARIFALTMLVLIAGALTYGGYSAFRAFTDSFIAPLTLSPNSEIVLSSKLKLDELGRERAQVAADLQRLDTELKANAQAVRRLRELQGKFQSSVNWMNTMNTHKVRVGNADLNAVNQQGQIAKTMLEEQKRATQKAEVDLNAGLITRMDYAKEMQRLSELQRSVLENERTRLQGQSSMYELQVAEQALKAKQDAPVGPQVLQSQEQLVRVELEIQRLESDMHVKSGLRDAALTRFGEVDLLADQLRSRPLFRAVNRKLDLAFVPYTQLDGVVPRAEIYACSWGIFFCKSVGRVTEILEGEITQQDPWGTPARGLYAVLSLTDHSAARAKTLRVRVLSGHTTKRRAAVATSQR